MLCYGFRCRIGLGCWDWSLVSMKYAPAFFRKIAVWNCCSNMMVDASWLICSTLWVEMQSVLLVGY